MKPGSRLHSAVCATTVVVVKLPAEGATLECGGAPMLEGGATDKTGEPAAGFDAGTLLGKRYADEASGAEVLCTKGGAGALSVNGRLLEIKAAKALPASD
jgi:hypothetical protein